MTQVEFDAGISGGGGASSMPPWLVPLLQFVVPAVAGIGGQVFSANKTSQAKAREREAAGRSAAELEPFLEQLIAMGNQIQAGGDYTGMRGQAMSNLDRMSEALNAQLAQRGIYSSGAALGQQRQLTGDVLSQLSQAIAADQLARQQAAGALYSNATQIAAGLPGLGLAPNFNVAGLGNLPPLPSTGYRA